MASVGDIPANGTGGRGLGNHDTPAMDITAFSGAARIGIGGMTTSLDGRAMFVTNLRDKSIYGVNIVDPDITPTVAVPFDTPVGVGQQLWAVTTYRNRLYLGYVDTGTRPGQSAAAAGHVSSVLPVTQIAPWSFVL